MARSKTIEKPVRLPVQARSAYTVEAIFEATIQVLVLNGMQSLTTTKVAERAGVSVGTLYQYFPNKNALLLATLERHLDSVVTAVEKACTAAKGQPVKVMAETLVRAYIEAKFREPEASRALYAVASVVASVDVVGRMTRRSQAALSDTLTTAADRTFVDAPVISYMLSTALVGPVQGLLNAGTPPQLVQQVQAQMVKMTCAYLLEAGSARPRRIRSS
jgi:AcrR family transcriptional regulator